MNNNIALGFIVLIIIFGGWYLFNYSSNDLEVAPVENGENIETGINPGEISGEENLVATKCVPADREVDVCIELYQPVCATISCEEEPCEIQKQTYSNSCKACADSKVVEYTEGECSI